MCTTTTTTAHRGTQRERARDTHRILYYSTASYSIRRHIYYPCCGAFWHTFLVQPSRTRDREKRRIQQERQQMTVSSALRGVRYACVKCVPRPEYAHMNVPCACIQVQSCAGGLAFACIFEGQRKQNPISVASCTDRQWLFHARTPTHTFLARNRTIPPYKYRAGKTCERPSIVDESQLLQTVCSVRALLLRLGAGCSSMYGCVCVCDIHHRRFGR